MKNHQSPLGSNNGRLGKGRNRPNITHQRRARRNGGLSRGGRRQLQVEQLEKRLLLVSDWTNPVNARDVDGDSFLAPIDALLGINQINLGTLTTGGRLPDRGLHPNEPNFDVSGDGFLTPIDVLFVINGLNQGFVPPAVNVSLVLDTGPLDTTNADGTTRVPAIIATADSASIDRMTVEVDGAPRLEMFRTSTEFQFDPVLATDGSDDGERTFRVTAFEGPVVANAQEFIFRYDTTPPLQPSPPALVAADDTGDSNTDNLTSRNVFTLSGQVGSGESVEIYRDGSLVDSTVADADGNWNYLLTQAVSNGEHTFQIAAGDNVGNRSEMSLPLVVTVDTVPPPAPLDLAYHAENQQIDLRFDDALSQSASNLSHFQLMVAGGPNDGQNIPITSAELHQRELKLNIPPLEEGQSYQLRVDTTLADVAGNTLELPWQQSFAVDESFRFTSVSPNHGESHVSLTREFIARFSEEIDPATITQDSLQVWSLGEPVPGRRVISSTNRFVTFYPNAPWSQSAEIQVVIDGNVIRAADGDLLDADANGAAGGTALVEFQTLSVTRIAGTEVFGFVRDSYSGNPIEGATIRVDALPEANVLTDADGFFRLIDVPAPDFFVHIDGSTAVNAPAGSSYPNVGKPFHSVPGQSVQLSMDGTPFDVFLPPMAGGDVQSLSPTVITEVGFGDSGKAELANLFPTIDASTWDLLQVAFEPGAAVDDFGNAATQAAVVPVPPDRIPAPLPDFLDPLLVISIQAPGASSFDIPAQITYPNIEGLGPGERTTIFSFDHDAGRWTAIGTATVSQDGLTAVSDPGSGILAPGWHNLQQRTRNTGEAPPEDPRECVPKHPDDCAPESFFEDLPEVLGFITSSVDGFRSYDIGPFYRPGPDETRVVELEIDGPLSDFMQLTSEKLPESRLESGQKLTHVLRPGDTTAGFFRFRAKDYSEMFTFRELERDRLYGAALRVTDTVNRANGTQAVTKKTYYIYRWVDVVDPDAALQKSGTTAVFGRTLADASDNFVRNKTVDLFLPKRAETRIDNNNPIFNASAPMRGDSVTWTFDPDTEKVHKADFEIMVTQAGDTLGSATSFETNIASLEAKGRATAPVTILVDTESYKDEFERVIKELRRDNGKDGVRNTDDDVIYYCFLRVLGLPLNEGCELSAQVSQNGGFQNGNLQAVPGEHVDFVRVWPASLWLLDKFLPGKAYTQSELDAFLDLQAEQLYQRVAAKFNALNTVATGFQISRSSGSVFAGPSTALGRYDDTSAVLFGIRPHGVTQQDSNKETIRQLLKADIPSAAKLYGLFDNINIGLSTLGVLREVVDVSVASHLDWTPPETYDGPINGTNLPEMSFAEYVSNNFTHEIGHVLGLNDGYAITNNSAGPNPAGCDLNFANAQATLGHCRPFDVMNGVRSVPLVFRAPNTTLMRGALGMNDESEDHTQLVQHYGSQLDLPGDIFGIFKPTRPVGPLEAIVVTQDGGPFYGDESIDLGVTVADGAGGEVHQTDFVIHNVGDETWDISQVTLQNGASGFSFVGTSLDGLLLEPGDSTVLELAFDPVTVGAASDRILLESGPDSNIAFELDVHAEGISPDPLVELELIGNNNLGGVPVLQGENNELEVFRITNRGAAPLQLQDIQAQFGGAEFSLLGWQGTTIELALGESALLGLSFDPTETGLRRERFEITTNDPAQPTLVVGGVGTGIPQNGVTNGRAGDDFVFLRLGTAFDQRLRSNTVGDFEFNLQPDNEYSLSIFDPETGYIAAGGGRTAAPGETKSLTKNLAFRPSLSPDIDFDGLPADIEVAIGTQLNQADTDTDGLDDFGEIQAGLNPLDGLVFPTGLIASLTLPGTSQELIVENPQGDQPIALLATGDHGVAILDLSELGNPIQLGRIDLQGTATDLALDTQTQQLIVATGIGGLQFVDVSNLMAPQLVRTLPFSGPLLETAFGLAYIASGTVLTTLDLSTGEVLYDRSLGNGFITDIVVQGNLLYTMDSERTLRIHEIDGTTLVPRGSLVSSEGAGRIFVGDGIVYAAAIRSFAGGGYATIDVSDPDAPTLISGSDVDETLIAPGTAIVPNGSGLGALIGTPDTTLNHRLDLMDLSDPLQTFVTLDTFPLPTVPHDATIFRGAAYVADDRGLEVVNFLPFDIFGQPPTAMIASPVQDVAPQTAGIQVAEGTSIPINTSVTDDIQVQRVQLLVNGQVVLTDESFPWTLSTIAPSLGDSTLSETGQLTIQVRAVDTGGNESVSNVLTFDVVADTIAPTLDALSPADGATGTPGIQIANLQFSEPMDTTTLNASTINLQTATGDDVLPSQFRFRRDDTQLQINYPALGPGSFLLTIDATAILDRAGNPLGTESITSQFTLEESNTLGIFPNLQLDVSEEPYGVAIGDVNGDGLPDIVSGNYKQADISILIATPDGGFAPSVTLPTNVGTFTTERVHLKDLDADNDLDVVVQHTRNQVTVFLGAGDGSFAPAVNYQVRSAPNTLEFGDVNSDGKLDIFSFRGSGSTILVGAGDGTFTREDVALRGNTSAVLADLNGDNKLDVIAEGSRAYDFFAGNGDGTFEEVVTTSLVHPNDPEVLAVADFNLDGNLDFAATNRMTFTTEIVSIFLGNGDGTFADPDDKAIPFFTDFMTPADLNNDGAMDLVLSNGFGRDGRMVLMTNDGQGDFSVVDIPTGGNPFSVAAGDLNGDGITDLVAPDRANNRVQIHLGVGAGFVAATRETNLGSINTYAAIAGAEMADLGGDGFADLVLAMALNPSKLHVLRGTGDGTFGALQEVTIGGRPTGMALADFNGDDVQDVFTFSQSSDNMTIAISDGNGVLTPTSYNAGDAPTYGAVGDVTGDGRVDVVTYTFLDQFLLMTSHSSGIFLQPSQFAVRDNVQHLALADLNDDGRSDVISFEQSSAPDAQIVVQMRNDAGGFDAPIMTTVPRLTTFNMSLNSADLDRDGNLDLVLAAQGSPEFSIYFGNGDGTFEDRVGLPNMDYDHSMRLVDIDADGKVDLVASKAGVETVGLFRGKGDGSFEDLLQFRTGKQNTRTQFDFTYLVVGDADGDADLDIGTGRVNSVNVLLQGGRTGLGGSNLLVDSSGNEATAAATLSVDQVAPIFAASIRRWAEAGLSSEYLATLQGIQLGIRDLGGDRLANAQDNVIWIDDDAAGRGWYVDADPYSDEEFTGLADELPRGVDLLSAVLHEMGHVLGLDHHLDTDLVDDLMDEMLGVGQRRQPTREHVDQVHAR